MLSTYLTTEYENELCQVPTYMYMYFKSVHDARKLMYMYLEP